MSVRLSRLQFLILLSFSVHAGILSGFFLADRYADQGALRKQDPHLTQQRLSIDWLITRALAENDDHVRLSEDLRPMAEAQEKTNRSPASAHAESDSLPQPGASSVAIDQGENGSKKELAVSLADISVPRPRYPERCQRLGIEGLVEVQIGFDESGRVREVELKGTDASRPVEGHCPEFAASAILVARQARLKPEIAALGGQSVILPVRFQLRQ
jgi:TonB family protein